MTHQDCDDDLIVFADEEESPAEAADRTPPWTILVVDDDPEIHAMTGFILSDFKYRDRPLRMLHALSAREAETVLRENANIAVILLDVVMETDDAGLRLAKSIRDDHGNSMVRIILRTGQPGMAPERLVLLEYDINDYKSKTELTADRMFTTVIAALRSFETIKALVDGHRALEEAYKVAETHRAATLALEKRKADERKAELDAIATHITMTVLPRLHDTSTMAQSLLTAAKRISPNTDQNAPYPNSVLHESEAIAECLEIVGTELKELLVVLTET